MRTDGSPGGWAGRREKVVVMELCERELSASGFQSEPLSEDETHRRIRAWWTGGNTVCRLRVSVRCVSSSQLAQALFSMATQQRTGNETQGMSVLWVGEIGRAHV